MQNKIRKVVIPAAGFGTRFLPQTKAMPKEMLPIVDKPVIQYVAEEAVASGIKDIIIVTGASKRAIEDHFDVPNAELIKNLENGNKLELLSEVRRISEMANFYLCQTKRTVRKRNPYFGCGTGDWRWTICSAVGRWIYLFQTSKVSQMMKVYEKYGGVVISGVRIEKKEDLRRYGIAGCWAGFGQGLQIKSIVEKPEPDQAPSNLATHGAYILPPEIFKALRTIKPGKGGEIWLVDAINLLREQGVPVYAVEIENGKYYDTGNKVEYMKTVVELAFGA